MSLDDYLKKLRTLEATAALNGLICTQTVSGNIVLSRLGGAWIFDNVGTASAWLESNTREVQA